MNLKSEDKTKLELNPHIQLEGENHGCIFKMFLCSLILELYGYFSYKLGFHH